MPTLMYKNQYVDTATIIAYCLLVSLKKGTALQCDSKVTTINYKVLNF